MTEREKILSGVRAALSALPKRAERPEIPPGMLEPHWLSQENDVPALFQRRLVTAGGRFFESPEACRDWFVADGVQTVYLAPELDALAGAFDGCRLVREYSRGVVEEVDAAVTLAAGAIAESGTIVLTDEQTPDRLAALAPWRHVAAVPCRGLVRTISDALAAMPDDPNIIWVTGPSKTADVEGILIQGVHGPGQQGCFFLESND